MKTIYRITLATGAIMDVERNQHTSDDFLLRFRPTFLSEELASPVHAGTLHRTGASEYAQHLFTNVSVNIRRSDFARLADLFDILKDADTLGTGKVATTGRADSPQPGRHEGTQEKG